VGKNREEEWERLSESEKRAFEDQAKQFQNTAAELSAQLQNLNETRESAMTAAMAKLKAGAEASMEATRKAWEGMSAAQVQMMLKLLERADPRVAISAWGGYDISDVDFKAVIALSGHFSQILNDPDIQASNSVSSAIRSVQVQLSELDIHNCRNPAEAFKALAYPARSAVNTENGKAKKRADGFKQAEALCQKWFANPSLYKNKAAFTRDVIEKQYCLDKATADRWLNELLNTLEPSEIWWETVGKKYAKRR
jgi:ElaB/YqjD/DUF883 family membrane-anchored ribosome-binding protein